MKSNTKDIASGAFFILAGLFYGALTLSNLRIGQALNMGPGYFPIVLSGLLVVMGAVVAFRGLTTGSGQPFGVVAWRGAIVITVAIVVFTLTFEWLGILVSSALTAYIACFSSSDMRPLKALFVSLGISVFCTLIFHYLIRLPVPLFGSVFGLPFG
ncbi:MAG: tripartite tricarboxylate transporter TctB family protein [Parvibaculaceae bacterium]